MIDAVALREVMQRYPTGVTVVATAGDDGAPCGLTVNSFTSVSLEPPLVLVCIDQASSSHDRLVEASSFAVSVLSRGQEQLARRFAVEPSPSRFDRVEWVQCPTGDPVLEGAAAWLACALHAVHAGGDHSILVGRVEALGTGGPEALAFYRGRFWAVGP